MTPHLLRRLLAAAVLAVVATACGDAELKPKVTPDPRLNVTGPPSMNLEGTITVAAAAPLTDAMKQLEQAYEDENRKVKVELKLGVSSELASQMRHGTAADVFATPDEADMKTLEQAGLISDRSRAFTRDKLQIVVRPGNPKKVQGLADLANEPIRAGWAVARVPAGKAAAEAVAKSGKQITPDFQEPDSKSVVNKVAQGSMDAGLAWASDVKAAGNKVSAVEVQPPTSVIYPMAVLKATKNLAAAQSFTGFVLSQRGQAILQGLGFLPPQ
ncbi:MAG TPA: molybdate ABC transporter substrate-binding protein [Actinomycetota bacterium]|nr:molybdate ABC transporter substrate-binding protein [Actinomycetota bacterium]